MKLIKITKSIIFASIFVILGIIIAFRFNFKKGNVNSENIKVAGFSKGEDFTSTSDKSGHSHFAIIAHEAIKTVVNIKTERSVSYRFASPFGNLDNFFGFGQGQRRQARPKTQTQIQKAEGSGFIYSADGYIMTNNHVVEKADKIFVKFSDNSTLEAKIVGQDPETDLAIIKVDKHFDDESVAKLGDSDKLWVGDMVIAIGSPYSLEKTVTVGVVSAKDRSQLNINGGPTFQDFIQTDAAINPGNSGGPLLNMNGEVIGINAAINAAAQGIGFAIPINLAMKIGDQLKDGGEIQRGYIGISLKEISADEKEPYGLDKNTYGVLVASVEKNTPAEEGGIKADDIIIALNGKKVTNYENFRLNVAAFAPKTKISLTILRQGNEKEISIVLGNRNEYFTSYGNKSRKSNNSYGLSAKNLNGNLKRQYNLNVDKGVFIYDVDKESKLVGKIYPGDVIVKIIINKKYYPIDNLKDFNNAMSVVKKSKSAFIIKFIRNNYKSYVLVK